MSEGYALRTSQSVSLSAESESRGTFAEKSPLTIPENELFPFLVSRIQETVKKINDLIKDIERNGLSQGTGHPEPLKYRKGWSRRIDHGNRLVYNIVDGNLWIASCKGHYED